MKREKPNKQRERGITLISLIIMIIVLVILSVVVIKGITGGEIISTTETAAEDYNITSYKEQIEQKVRGTVQSYSIKGQEIGITKIAEKLNNETLWVRVATANTDLSINNEDILVTTIEGYVFQVYYNETYGDIFVEYIGKDAGKEFPNLKARYEKKLASIIAETKASKLELIYRGEVKEPSIEKPKGEQKISVEESRNRLV